MRIPVIWSNWVLPFVVISILYIAAFVLTIYWIFPFQSYVTPQIAEYTSLLFLPHGVRVLSAWLLGWRSIIIMAPAALYTHWLIMGWSGFSVLGVMGAMCGVTCAAFAFWLVGKYGMDLSLKPDSNVHWSEVMFVGVIASVFNSLGMGFAFGHSCGTISGYFIGDITGLFACLLILMVTFKLLRLLE